MLACYGRRVLKSSANIILPEASLYIVTLCLCSNPANLHAPEQLRTVKRAHGHRRQQTRATGVHAAPPARVQGFHVCKPRAGLSVRGDPTLVGAGRDEPCLVSPRVQSVQVQEHNSPVLYTAPAFERTKTPILQYSNVPMSQFPKRLEATRLHITMASWRHS